MSDEMFSLEKAVQQWCELVLSNDSIKSRNIDELKDHLYCEVENFQQQGIEDSEAFKLAIKKMGEIDLLSGEFEKNRTFLQKLCAFEYGTVADHENKTLGVRSMMIQQSILWAAAIIATTLILDDKQQAMSVVFTVLLPLSVVNIISLRTRSAAKEYQCIKRKLKAWFK